VRSLISVSNSTKSVEGYAISGLYDLIAKVMMPTYDALGEAIPDKVHTMHGFGKPRRLTLMVFNVFKVNIARLRKHPRELSIFLGASLPSLATPAFSSPD